MAVIEVGKAELHLVPFFSCFFSFFFRRFGLTLSCEIFFRIHTLIISYYICINTAAVFSLVLATVFLHFVASRFQHVMTFPKMFSDIFDEI